MSWHLVDDGFPEHPKLEPLELDPRLWADAVSLWLAAGCYCQRAGTEGFVSDERLVRLTPMSPRRARQVAKALVERARISPHGDGLLERVDGGYLFHDWDDIPRKGGAGQGAAGADDGTNRPRSGGAERTRRWREKRRSERDAKRRHRDGVRDGHGDGPGDVTVTSRRDSPPPRPTPPVHRAVPSQLGCSGGEDPKTANVGARAHVREVPPPNLSTFGLLRSGYARRYEAQLQDAWMSEAANRAEIQHVAAWAERQAELRSLSVAEVVEGFLDALFSIERLRKHRWPWKWAAEDPAKILAESGAVVAAEVEQQDELERLLELEQQARSRGDQDAVDRYRAERRRVAAARRRARAT